MCQELQSNGVAVVIKTDKIPVLTEKSDKKQKQTPNKPQNPLHVSP